MGHVCLNWKLWMGNRAWTWTHEKWVVRFPRGEGGGGGGSGGNSDEFL